MLKDKLLLMSHKAEQMISDSIRALVDAASNPRRRRHFAGR